jgi:hypothetical protein
MINEIDPLKSAITSLVSATFGTFTNYCAVVFAPLGFISLNSANTAFQHAAWTVAILAGIVSVINGVRQWHFKKREKQ